MVSIKDQLLSAEEAFLTALSDGEGAVVAFHARWEALVAEVDSVASSTGLDDEVSALCHTIAMRIAVLADISAELTTTCDAHTSLLMGQLDNLMCELSLEDESPSKLITHRTADDTPSTRKRRHSSSRFAPSKRQRVLTQTTSSADESPSVFSSSMTSSTTTTLRKRRFSDANANAPSIPPSKRLHFGPRHHAVSDSYISLLQPVSSTTPSAKLGQTTASSNSSPLLDIQPFDASQLDFISHCGVGSQCNLSDAVSFPASPPELDGLDDFILSLGAEAFNVEPPAPSFFFPDDASFLDRTDVPFPVDLPATPTLYVAPPSPSSSSSTTSSCPNTPPTKSSLELTIDFPTSSISQTICHPLLLDDFGYGASMPEIALGTGVDASEDMHLLLAPIDLSMCYLLPPNHVSPGSDSTTQDDLFDVFNHPSPDPNSSAEQEMLRRARFEAGVFYPTLISCC